MSTIMRKLWFLFLLPSLCWGQTYYNQTDVISTNAIALTNKTIDCSLNTCTNVPAGGISLLAHSVLGNATGSTAAGTSLTGLSFDFSNTGGWGSTKTVTWASQSGWTLPVSSFFWTGPLNGTCLSSIVCSSAALLSSNDNVTSVTANGQSALLTMINQVGTTGNGQKEAAYFQMKVNSNAPNNPGGAYQALQLSSYAANADVTSNNNAVVDGTQTTTITNTAGAITYTGGTNNSALTTSDFLYITGTNTGSGSISGYVSGTTYIIGSANPGAHTFVLLNRAGGAVTTTAGTLVGLTFNMRSAGVWGQTTIATLNSGGTNYFNVTGHEIDVGINTGASASKILGLSIVGDTASAVKGSDENAGIQVGAIPGWVGFDAGLTFGGAESSNPFTSSSIAICFWPHGTISCGSGSGAWGSVGSVLDASNVTISNYFLRSTGYSVDGSGNEVANSVSAPQLTSTVAIGTAPLVVTSTTNVPNLNASSLNGATFAAPGSIGSVTPGSGAFTTLTSSSGMGLGQLASQATNTIVGNATSGSAVPTALAIGGCSSSSSALIWTTNTGFGCNTSINAATLGGATFAAPGAIGGGTSAAGTFTTLTANGAVNLNASNNAVTNIATGTTTSTFTIGQNSATPGQLNVLGPVSFQAGTAYSAASWLTTSPVWNGAAMTLNDSTASGTVANAVAYSLQAPNFTSTGGASTTFTAVSTLYVAAPTCSGGVVCTNLYAINSAGRINGTAGLNVSGATVNINNGSNQITNINTGSSNAAVHIADGTGNNTIGIGNGTGVVTGASPWTFSNATIKMTAITTGTNADTVCLKADGTLLIQAAACTISSLRFKEDVKDVENSTIPEISNMRVASFRMKDGAKNVDPNAASTQTGLIAENIAQVAPECAIYENDMKTPKSYRQECVIALLVKGEQELVEQNAMLKKRISQLEAR